MNPLIKYGVAVFAVLAALFGAYRHGCNVTQAEADIVATKAALQHASDQTALAEHYRQIEAKAAADMAAIDEQHQLEKRNAQIISERTIAGLRDGSIRLRDKFANCTAYRAVMPEAAAGAGERDAAAPSGLQPEDVQFLVSAAALADEVVGQLHACQAVIKLDRQVE